MCTKPIRIKNNSKYIALNTGHAIYVYVPCGKCNECVKAKQNEWTLRTYYESRATLNQGGYIYFDTLTYSNDNLPRLSNFNNNLKFNWACFNYRDIRAFYENLRQMLKLREDRLIRYFITAEYGELRHRNHYHIMLFVNANIDPLYLSKCVAKSWKKGRTDGMPWKSSNYVLQHNYLNTLNIDCIRYISKYVNKSQTFMNIINDRWKKLEKFYEKSKFNKLELKKIKKQYYRLCTPFHRQSQGYGISAIENLTVDDIIKNPVLTYPNTTINLKTKVRLPIYFYRKLFQKQIKYMEKRIWINNEDGIKFKKAIEQDIVTKIEERLTDLNASNNNRYKTETLKNVAHYIYYERGRLSGTFDYKPHHEEADIYNYNTDKDLIYLGKKTYSKKYAGNDTIGYCTTNIEQTSIENQAYINNEYEIIIDDLMKEKDTTKLVCLKEHMNQIRKAYFQPI